MIDDEFDDEPFRVGLGTEATFEEAVALTTYHLAHGSLVIVPTDTIYGLAANAMDETAVSDVYSAKRRPTDQKLPLLIAEPDDVSTYSDAPAPCALELARRFWPGALTIVVKAAADLPAWLVDERGAVALRCPDHDFIRAVARSLGGPLAATSVNFSGAPEGRGVEDVPAELLESVDLVVDGGPSPGVASTVVECLGDEPLVLRQGAVEVR